MVQKSIVRKKNIHEDRIIKENTTNELFAALGAKKMLKVYGRIRIRCDIPLYQWCPSQTPSGGGSSSTTPAIVKYVGSPGLGMIQTASDNIVMPPSNASDFANNDPKTVTLDFVNPTGPDAIGNYYVKGEVVNNGNTTMQNLKITAHWYDSTLKLIGVTFGYPDNVLQPLDSGKRTTFTIPADGHSDLLGKPKFVELSYDWQ